VIFEKRRAVVRAINGRVKLIYSMCAVAAAMFVGGGTIPTHDMNAINDLKGTWTCVSAKVDGNELPEATTAALRLTLTEDRYKTEKGSQVLFDSTYTIDLSTNPKQINMVGTEGDLMGKEAQGIYSLESDTLRICYTMPGLARPQRFESPAGSKAYLVVWKRG
jgi:uncharacterized protein (TIGR03067 family)